MGMTCHPSGVLLATAGADKKVLVWDVDGGFCTHSFSGHKGVVTSILFHPNHDRLLVRFLLWLAVSGVPFYIVLGVALDVPICVPNLC